MEKIPRHIDIDYSKYAPDIPEDQLEAYYGLPKHVQFCKECVMSNQKPNSCYEFEHTINSIKKTMVIQEDGVCDACHACHNKANGHIDWALREKELRELCDQYRKNDGSYDCLVPGSGGKDSFYAAHLLKYKYGMHPLTVTWAPHIYTPWGWENMQAWIHAGFDNYLCTPNGMTHRLLTRLATENLFHPFQPFILGQIGLVHFVVLLQLAQADTAQINVVVVVDRKEMFVAQGGVVVAIGLPNSASFSP